MATARRRPFGRVVLYVLVCSTAALANKGGKPSLTPQPIRQDRVLKADTAGDGRSLRTCPGTFEQCQAANKAKLPADCTKEHAHDPACVALRDDFKKNHYDKVRPEPQYADKDEDHLVEGRASDYVVESVPADEMDDVPTGSFLAWREQVEAKAIASSDPTSFIANDAWNKDGREVHSCKEYVYKKFWDWSRFEDRVFACKANFECIYDATIAALAPPASERGKKAHRQLADREGEKLPKPSYAFPETSANAETGQLVMMTGVFPKNLFFTVNLPALAADGTDPLAAALPDLSPDLPDLRALLADGRDYYKVNMGAVNQMLHPNEDFTDEWTWAETLHGRNQNVPAAVARAVTRRTRVLAENLAGVEARLHQRRKDTPQERPEEALEALGPAPIYRMLSVQNANDRVIKGNPGPGTFMAGYGPAGVPGVENALVGEFTLMPGWQKDPASRPGRPHLLCDEQHTPVHVVIRGSDVGDKAYDATAVAQCLAWNLLFDEWARLKKHRAAPGGCTDQGNCGCLYLGAGGGAACDFSVHDFAERWVATAHYLKERTQAWNRCHHYEPYVHNWKEAWTKNLGGYEDALKTGQATYEKWEKVPTVNKKDEPLLGFGDDTAGKSTFGDKSLFAAGYEYEAGWQLKPIGRIELAKQTAVCQMEGRVWGSFRANAWILGSRPITVVDAGAWVIANKKRKGQPVGSGEINYGVSFDLADLQTLIDGIELYDEIGDGTWYSKLGDKALEKAGKKIGKDLRKVAGIPPRYDGSSHHDEDTFLQATMSIGPVPITVKAGAGLDYGADFEPRAKNDPENCSAAIREFGADLEFTPHIATRAFVGGGIGVPGFSVGARVDLTLVKLQLPVDARVGLTRKNGTAQIDFGMSVDALLSTLSGVVSFEFECLIFHELVELFRWSGIGPVKVEIVPEIKGGPYRLDDLNNYVNEKGSDAITLKKADDK